MTTEEDKYRWLGVFLIIIGTFVIAVVYNNYAINYNEYTITFNNNFLYFGILWFLIGFFVSAMLIAVGAVLTLPRNKKIVKTKS